LFELTLLGIGATVGTGIFIVLNKVVPDAGPAVVLSFVVAGITAALTALCYAEMASTVPVSGSSYSYAYATLGEIVAYFVGWCLLLEYGVSASAIAVGWGEYLNQLADDLFGFTIPEAFSAPPGDGGIVNVPSLVLVLLCTLLLIRGASESALVNAVMVLIKVAVLLFFVVVAFTAFQFDNFTPFAPNGVSGIGIAASSIFFSFIGIDAVSTAGEEVHNPRKTLPLAIILSLLAVTTLYILVAVAGVGAAEPDTFDPDGPPALPTILRALTGTWGSALLSAGAVISIFSVTLVVLYGQTRILFTMSRDGLLPTVFHDVDPRSGTPLHNTLIVGGAVAFVAAFVPLSILLDLTSMGTLVAFTVVSLAVIILRQTQPHLPRGFKVPLYPVVPIVNVLFCLYLIRGLPPLTFLLFAIWLTVAAILYFSYGLRHSHMERGIHGVPPGGTPGPGAS
jgi:APA family basic amino acid/polyamine antiporter